MFLKKLTSILEIWTKKILETMKLIQRFIYKNKNVINRKKFGPSMNNC